MPPSSGSAAKEQSNVHKRRYRPRYLNITFTLPFFGLALLLDVYVRLTLSIDEGTRVRNDALLLIPRLESARDAAMFDLSSTSYDFNPPSNATRASPSLAIVSACIPGERFPPEYVSISRQNKLHYCEKYNAKCVLPTQRVDNQSDLHPKWDKLHHINHTLHTQQIDWLLWMDCDSAFTNFEIDWYQHLQPYLDSARVMVVSEDNSWYNLGVFMVPNTRTARKFIENMYKLRWSLDKQYFHKDQSALRVMIERHPSVEERIMVVPQTLINTYLDNVAGVEWQPYHWIVHQVFCGDVIGCTKNFTSVLKRVTPHYFPDSQEEEIDVDKESNEDSGALGLFSSWWNKLLQ